VRGGAGAVRCLVRGGAGVAGVNRLSNPRGSVWYVEELELSLVWYMEELELTCFRYVVELVCCPLSGMWWSWCCSVSAYVEKIVFSIVW
jgi:hypothetical protein